MHLFFDLDGTLTDSSQGMLNCYRHAFECLGRDVPDEPRLRWGFGPPLAAVFESLLESTDPVLIERAINAYRSRYAATGLFENALLPGIADGLQTLVSAGHKLRVVTIKPEAYAERILQHLEIARHFDDIHGPSLDDRRLTKTDLLRKAIAAANSHHEDVVMIGDRSDDIHAARTCGVRSVAAAWGFGSDDELRMANADYTARSIGDVVKWVLGQ